MTWRNPRRQLVICAGLDVCGLAAIFFLLDLVRPLDGLRQQWPYIVLLVITYLCLGWLFGSYTVLRWRRVPLHAVLQRVLTTGVATVAVIALFRVALNPSETVWVLHRSTQLIWLLPQMFWSLLIRGLLRRGLILPAEPQYFLVADDVQADLIQEAWRRTPPRQPLHRLPLQRVLEQRPPVVVAVAPLLLGQGKEQQLLDRLEQCDPREFGLTTPLKLLERQLERLPPSLLPEPWVDYSDLPWNDPFNLQRQLKRVADVIVAATLLVLTSPLIALVSLLIWLEDRGPVFYVQERSGWLGRVFRVYKLRTMVVAPANAPASWTSLGDRRITRVGQWLRPLRLDELPQLFNVLTGDMSLIGPRPERPELEYELEVRIPHYRKRHWMRPGLSGWAQVCAPYAASIEDSELKLSYDLYYLKNFSTWLDLLILFRTIKTVLKAGGR